MRLVAPLRGRTHFIPGRIALWTFRPEGLPTISFVAPIPESSATTEPIQRLATPFALSLLFRHPIPLSLPRPLFSACLRAAHAS